MTTLTKLKNFIVGRCCIELKSENEWYKFDKTNKICI